MGSIFCLMASDLELVNNGIRSAFLLRWKKNVLRSSSLILIWFERMKSVSVVLHLFSFVRLLFFFGVPLANAVIDRSSIDIWVFTGFLLGFTEFFSILQDLNPLLGLLILFDSIKLRKTLLNLIYLGFTEFYRLQPSYRQFEMVWFDVIGVSWILLGFYRVFLYSAGFSPSCRAIVSFYSIKPSRTVEIEVFLVLPSFTEFYIDRIASWNRLKASFYRVFTGFSLSSSHRFIEQHKSYRIIPSFFPYYCSLDKIRLGYTR